MGRESRSKLGNNRPVIIDFDDLCDENDGFDTLLKLKERDDGFKVTLFAIPTRCSDELLAKYTGQRHWIELAVHGWRHARHECLAWTSEETAEKLEEALKIYSNFAHVFKAPNWEICDEVYEGCKGRGFAVADHARNIAIMPADMPHYIYNLRLRNDKYSRYHGHIQDYAGTGLTEAYETWNKIPVGTPYKFVSEVIVDEKEIPA